MNKKIDAEVDYMTLSEKKIDLSAIFRKYFSYWKLFLFSILLSLTLAIVYIYFTLPQYKVTTSILFKDDQKGGTTEMNVFREMGVVTRRSNVDNEIEILKKSLIVESVVRKLNIYVNYTEMKQLGLLRAAGIYKIFPGFPRRKAAVLYGNECSVLVRMEENELNHLPRAVEFDLHAYRDGNILFTGNYKGDHYSVKANSNDTIVRLPFGNLLITKGKTIPAKEMIMKIMINQPRDVANQYLNSLEIELTSKTSSVADLTLVTSNMELGRSFLKEYIVSYNEQGIRDQLELAEKTSQLINEHLSKLSNELSDVENLAQDYKQSQGLTDIASQADLYNSQLASVGQRKMDVESQYSIVSNLNNYVQQKKGHDQLLPANSGIQSQVLNSQIDQYNDLVLERNRLSRIASSSNQSMIDLNSQIESTYNSVKSGLQNEKNNLEIQQKDINAIYYQNSAKIRAIPRQERVFSDIKRQQNIKEALFLYLLQKKEERYMNMTTVEPSSKLIDNIHVMGLIWPNSKLILLLFFAAGLILPGLGIKTRELLRYQLDNKEQLEEISSIPLLGEIPKTEHTQVVVVKENSNDSFNEMMRLLRANLLFVIDSKEKKVINMLSSIGGEGKSFVSLNLAMSLALLDKKVLIVDLDIRKPKLAKVLGLDNQQGITLYLSGYLDKNELVIPSGIHPNLSVITAGSIPPNPNELLAKPLLDELIQELKRDYDFIFIDTAPAGLVSDSFLLNRIADVNLFVIRAGTTPKKFIEDADRYFRENRLKKMYFILNYVDLNSVDYRYGLYKKSGYGYE